MEAGHESGHVQGDDGSGRGPPRSDLSTFIPGLAYHFLVNRPRLLHWSEQRVGREEAEDVVHDVFISVLRHLEAGGKPIESLGAYVHAAFCKRHRRVAKIRARWLRRHSYIADTPEAMLVPAPASADEKVLEEDNARLLTKIYRRLRPSQRGTLEGMLRQKTLEEIAEQQKISDNTARNHRTEVRKTVAEVLVRAGYEWSFLKEWLR